LFRSRKTLLRCAAFLVISGCAEAKTHVEAHVRVEAGPPTVQDVDVTLEYPVELEADESVSINAVAISGFLRRVLVDVGDKVRAGQLIAVIDCGEYAAQHTQAETTIAKWEAQVLESTTRYERLLKMGKNSVVPAEIDTALKEARVAEAELAEAQAKLSEAGQRQGYCSLTAPFSGYVTERFLDPGAMVGPGSLPVVNIVKTRDVRVIASIVEGDAPKVARGAEVDVVLHAFPDTVFRAHVTRVGRSLDPTSRTLRVEMDIPNKSDVLLPGMTGRAAIVVDRREKALLVPFTAILKLEDVAYAYVVHDQDGQPRAHRVEVETGVDFGDWLEVREGLAETDRVITIGRELVDEGTRIDVVESDATRAAPLPEIATPATPEPAEVLTDSGTGGEAAAPVAETSDAAETDARGTQGSTPPVVAERPTKRPRRVRAEPSENEPSKSATATTPAAPPTDRADGVSSDDGP
jgi:membrane fusion protein (multidrug efflux system)